jgi:hypothetical protein
VRRTAPETKAGLALDVFPAAPYLVPLAQKVPRPLDKQKFLETLRGHSPDTAALASSAGDVEYIVDVDIGGQKF